MLSLLLLLAFLASPRTIAAQDAVVEKGCQHVLWWGWSLIADEYAYLDAPRTIDVFQRGPPQIPWAEGYHVEATGNATSSDGATHRFVATRRTLWFTVLEINRLTRAEGDPNAKVIDESVNFLLDAMHAHGVFQGVIPHATAQRVYADAIAQCEANGTAQLVAEIELEMPPALKGAE